MIIYESFPRTMQNGGLMIISNREKVRLSPNFHHHGAHGDDFHCDQLMGTSWEHHGSQWELMKSQEFSSKHGGYDGV